MLRLIARLVLAALVALGVLLPAAIYGEVGDGTSYEPTSITNYDATFDVDEGGDLRVTERLTIQFPSGDRHGIFRFFDVVDPNDSSARREPHDLTVTRDGAAEPFAIEHQGQGRYVVARIGSADVWLNPGPHVFVLDYRIDDVLEPGTEGAASQFYWNLIPGGWQQAIAQARLEVNLPADVRGLQCAVGVGAADGTCDRVTGDGTPNLVITTADLPPRTPVTVKAGLEVAPPPPAQAVAWSPRFDPVLGRSWPVVVIVALLALGALAYGLRLSRQVFEPKPPFPLQYAPPEGIGPAQASYIFTEKTDRAAYVASVLEAARSGAVRLEKSDSGWQITDATGAEGWRGLDPITTRIGRLVGGAGRTFVAGRKDILAGEKLKSELASFGTETRSWAREAGLMTKAGPGSLGGVIVVLAVLLAGAICIFNPFDMSLVAAIPGLFAIGGLATLSTGATTKRTATGRDLWSRIGGFRRVLSTPSSTDRFDFSGREELYTAYIPWAVAFGVAQEWANKYRTEVGTEPPVPWYLGGAYAGSHTGDFTQQMVGDFSETVRSAISSYQATQTSSSGGGGGGGFSGGGGGGGGGGGSW